MHEVVKAFPAVQGGGVRFFETSGNKLLIIVVLLLSVKKPSINVGHATIK